MNLAFDGQKEVNSFGRQFVAPGMIKADYARRLENGRIQCELCPRMCKLSEGQRGFCYVRMVQKGQLVLSSYGRASGFCIDPIEKKPLNHFYPGTSILSFGTSGCNLGCRYCQNWDISKARDSERLNQWASPEEIAQAAQRAGCKSVAFTYNEPIIFTEFARDCAMANRDLGVKSVAVTAGYINPIAQRDFFQFMDGVNIDLKAFSQRFYRKLCFAHLEPVLDTLRFLRNESDAWFEVTTLLIPGENDSADEISKLCEWFVENLGPEVPLHFTAFHPDFKLNRTPPTSAKILTAARNRAIAAGIQHVYTGNVHDAAGQSTFCTHCDHLLIERNYYQLGRYAIDDRGCCQKCGTKVAGRFDVQKGSWDARIRRVKV